MKPLSIAHLDFKGLQQHPHVLLERLDALAGYGYRAVLAEYEDVFPYRSGAFSDQTAEIWSADFHREFLERAHSNGMEVIPLQQTLGHLEYALRWEKQAAFRLRPDDPTTLDLTSPEARAWILGLLGEMMDAHPDSRHVHLGMDEARPLAAFARQAERDPLGMFLDHLDCLLDFCEARGKTPIIWSDMLEDHLRPETLPRIRALRERVILACWDYAATARPETKIRFAGWRVSRHWLDHPEAGGGPALKPDTEWFEEWPSEIQSLVAPYRASASSFQSLCPAAIWKGLGFRVWGAGAASPSEDGPLIPLYHRRMENLDRWRGAVQDWRLEGLIVTAWARSQTCSPPGSLPDLQMPMYRYALRGDFGDAEDPTAASGLHNLFLRLGRCRESWWIEPDLIHELESSPAVGTAADTPRKEGKRLQKLPSHQKDGSAGVPPAFLATSGQDSRTTLGDNHRPCALQETAALPDPIVRGLLLTMLRIQAARRQLDLATYNSERFLCGDRMPAPAWEPRAAAIEAACQNLSALRAPTRAHLEQRHFGQALEEWLELVFDTPLESATALLQKIANKKQRATTRFAG